MTPIPNSLLYFYYISAALAVVFVFVRVVYSWFRDFDNAQKFTSDMAQVHLPYIYNCMNRIANRLDIDLDPAPQVNFTYIKKSPQS